MIFEDILCFFNKKRKRYRIRPNTVIIDISNRCNAICPFCSRQTSSINRQDMMTRDMFYDIMKQVEKIKTVKSIALAAFGEPLLHPNFDEFANYVVDKKYMLTFPTNMSLAHKHFDTLLKASNIIISVEGYDKQSYEKLRKNLIFENTYNNIKEFNRLVQEHRQKGLSTPTREFNFLLTKSSNVDKYMTIWKDMADIIRVAPMLKSLIWNKDLNKTVLYTNKEFENDILPCNSYVNNMYCAQPFNTIIIRANGDLALCCTDYDFDYNFGNYKNIKKSFFENKQLNQIRKEFELNELNVCKNCFQNFEINQSLLFKYLPELKKYENDPKIKIYGNR